VQQQVIFSWIFFATIEAKKILLKKHLMPASYNGRPARTPKKYYPLFLC
jgi:hypothetical protein